MEQNKLVQKTPRRGFLGTLAAGAAAIGLSALATPFKLNAAVPEPPADANQLDAFFNKINGKQRMVFDATHPHEMFPFAWPKVFLMTNEQSGTPSNECSAVVVLRHSAIGYALDDKLWAKYKLGEVFEANDHKTMAPALRNPFWQPKTGDFAVPGLGNVQIGINELQAAGVLFCVCETAMTVYSAVIADKIKGDAAAIRAEWVAGILPGVQPVPSGVWALGRAQAKGCGYVFTG